MTGNYNEDLEQEVYIKTWKNLDNYKEEGKFKSWLNVVTANICRDYLKSSSFKKNNMTDSDENIKFKSTEDKQLPENQLLAKHRQKRIIDAIEKLKPKFKEVIVLYEIQELSYEEISKITKCPIGTIKSRLFNARKELSVTLKDLL